MSTQIKTYEFWRNPTAYEIKFGEGAIINNLEPKDAIKATVSPVIN